MRYFQSDLNLLTSDSQLAISSEALSLAAEQAGKFTANSLYKSFTAKNDEGVWLRLSSLGAPAVDQLANRFKLEDSVSAPISARQISIFHDGNAFEGEFLVLATVMGYKPDSSQSLVQFEGVYGHTDFIVTCPHTQEQWVVELKTMKQQKWDTLNKLGIEAFPKYITQLATYEAATGLPGMWVIKNKNTGEIQTLGLTEEQRQTALKRARSYLEGFKKVKVWEDTFNYFMPPPAVPMMRSGNVIGYKVPDSMRWSKNLDRIYYLKPSGISYAIPVQYPYYRMPEGMEEKGMRWASKHNNL